MSTNTLTFTNTWAQLEGPNIQQARELLSYKQKGYVFTQAYKRGHWNGTVYMMSATGKLPAGLVPELVERLEQEGINVETVDDRPPKPIPDPCFTTVSPCLGCDRGSGTWPR